MRIWDSWGEPFSKPYNIFDRGYWNKFWDNCTYTEKQIYIALRNIHYAVNNNYYERRYISNDPCKFIQGGMIERSLNDFDGYCNDDGYGMIDIMRDE